VGAARVDVVLANNDRVTLRVGDVFLEVGADQTRTDIEVEALSLAPVPTPEILWRRVGWLFENGYGDPDQLPEVAVLRSHA